MVAPSAGSAPALAEKDLEEAVAYARAEKATATRREYRTDFRLFQM